VGLRTTEVTPEPFQKLRLAVVRLPTRTAVAEASAHATREDQMLPKRPLPAALIDKTHLAPGWQAATPILCIAGRGLLDEAASSRLAPILEKHGRRARASPLLAAAAPRGTAVRHNP
jgi:hypothetical protein